MTEPIVSHGRGGTGNIGADPAPYTDGEIIREGPIGDQPDGAYSTGRGGQGNIGSPGTKATHRNSEEVIPEAALRPSMEDSNYHVGRGGEGNAHIGKPEKRVVHEGLADKLKNKLFRKKASEASTT